MASDDWFRSDDWDDEARACFERKLARARPHGRVQYLRIKALSLLETTDPERREAGVALLQRLLCEHGDVRAEAAGAHVMLAEYHEQEGDPGQALTHYRESLVLAKGTNVFWGAELTLAELIVREQLAEHYDEATELLDTFVADDLVLRSDQYRYAVLRARLAQRQHRSALAAAYARGALQLFDTNRPLSSRHPEFGLARADEATLEELEVLADQADPEDIHEAVGRYRGSDGEIRWEWALIRQLHDGPKSPRLTEQEAFDAAAAPLVAELRAAGLEVYDLEEWAGTRLPNAAAVRAAGPILVRWLTATDDPLLKAVIAQALTDRRLRAIATAPVMDEFCRLVAPELNGSDWPSESVGRLRRLKGSLARALATLARDAHFAELSELLRDRRHGRYRVYVLWALPYVKLDAAVDLALELLDDNELEIDALHALADLRSERARPVLEAFAAQPRPRGRSDDALRQQARVDVAAKGLAKLDKARANGRARP